MKVDMEAALSHRIAVLLLIISAGTILFTGCDRESGNPELYLKYCASCHGPEGEGLRSLYPPLQGSHYLAQRIDQLPCLIVKGVRATQSVPGRPSKMRMPAFTQLDIRDLTDLTTYLHTTWGTRGQTPSKQDVEVWLQGCR